jgi:hypothetical protein
MTTKKTTKKKTTAKPKVKVDSSVIVTLDCKKSENNSYDNSKTAARLVFEKQNKEVNITAINTSYGDNDPYCTKFHVPIVDLKKAIEEVEKEYKLA